jgi:hypothetical protein
MTEQRVWFSTGRGLGLEIARGEPSHIHLPRRRRVARPDDQDTNPTWGAHVGDDEHLGQAQPATEEA